jgi:uncharacterized protein involved in outer membrane biogenesis
MSLGSILAALATIVLTVLAALLALPYVVDWNEYKAQFEAQAAKLVGRPVHIEGKIDLSILPIPHLDLRGVRISDEYGKFERPFAEVEGLNAVLSLPSLLSGIVEARTVILDQPIIRLKTDEFGEGTWQSVGPYGLDMPIPVREIVLNAVDIKDGAIELRQSRRQGEATRIDRISGTFSAESLSGPFRFVGLGSIDGRGKEIKLSAARGQDSKSLRLKASLHSVDGISLYQLDGDIKGLDGPLQYVGPVVARLALDTAAKQAKPDQIGEPMAGKAVEFRAAAKITLEDAKLENIALTVTQNDRPQSFTGTAYASWAKTPRLNLEVEASFLDIDQMLRTEQSPDRPTPTLAIAALPKIFEGWSFKPREGEIKARIQQAGLGGDVIEGLNFAASHDAEGWRITTLIGKLPGETDVDIKGTSPAGKELGFNGQFDLKGKNLSRLLRWAAPSLGVVDAGGAENFSLSGNLTLTPEQLAFRDTKGALGSSSFSADLVHDYGKESKLLLLLDSERLDLRPLYGKHAGGPWPAGPGEDPAIASPGPQKGEPNWTPEVVPASTSLIDVLRTVFRAEQSNVSLLITQLQLPDFEARDVRSAFRYENGTFDIRELNLATTDGLKVKADGQIRGLDSRPDGALNLSIDAPSAQSVTNLARLAGFDSVSSGARARIEAMAPFRLTGKLGGTAKERLLKLTLAGNAGGSELSFTGQMHGDWNNLPDARVDVSGVIGNSDGRRLIAQLAPEVPLDKADQPGSGFVKISAQGAMKSGLASRIDLQTPHARGRFEGQIAPLEAPAWGFNGELNMRASQAATALSMLRISPGGTPVTGAIDLKASISKSGAKYQLGNLSLTIGGETVRGTAEVDVAGDRPAAKIDIQAASVTLPKIAAYLIDWGRQDITSQFADVASGGESIWPNKAFLLSALQAGDGTLQIKAPAIWLSDDIKLGDGRLEASLKSGTLTLSKLQGQLYGGTFSGSGALKALQGRAGFDAKVKLGNVDLAALSKAQGGTKLADGNADFEMTLEGQGLSPRGILTVLSGSGELKLTKGKIYGLSPAALKTAGDTYLSQEIPDKAQLTAKLDGDFRKGSLPFEQLTIPVVVKDGVLRVADVEVKGPDYKANAGAIVDLASFRLDSEWDVTYLGKATDGQPLPPVRLAFAGPVAQFSSLTPQLDADQFERYLSIKRIDRDMDKLEKLNEQRGNPRNAPARPVAKTAPGSGVSEQHAAPAPSAGGPGEPAPPVPQGPPNESIPTQSLLRAPPVILEPPTEQRQVNTPAPAPPAPAPAPDAPATPPAAATSSGWSTGTETTTTAPAATDARRTQAEPQQPETPTDFEARIREVLRAQEQNARQ